MFVSPNQLHDATALVIEGNPQSRAILVSQLRELGVGTVSQALRAGVPQLIVPFSHDQPDNAARVVKLGCGAVVKPRRYTGPREKDAGEEQDGDGREVAGQGH